MKLRRGEAGRRERVSRLLCALACAVVLPLFFLSCWNETSRAHQPPDYGRLGLQPSSSDSTSQVISPLTLGWSSDESDDTKSVAWADYDRDGDLDLAVGNMSGPARLYRNEDGNLTSSAIWSSEEGNKSIAIAWGDYDGDGDLDLAIGNNGQPNKIYRNEDGVLGDRPAWASAEADSTSGVAWGDYDGDGDLDLAAVNVNEPSRLYRNDGGILIANAVWSPSEWGYTDEGGHTTCLAWADYDLDNDLDLMAGFRLYRNDSGTLTSNAVWSPAGHYQVQGMAWGDYDKDGDLDVAIAGDDNYSKQPAPIRLHRNDAGRLSSEPIWLSAEEDQATSLAWGDYDSDGDLDLAVGNLGYGESGAPNRLYTNDEGSLVTTATWSSPESDDTMSVAFGDYDGDGDLDLAVGNGTYERGQPNRLYRNDAGTLTTSSVWSSSDSFAFEVSWGDVDGDGDLDLAAGGWDSGRLYGNNAGHLSANGVWTAEGRSYSVAWADFDNDSDLDLAVSGYGQANRVFRNEDGELGGTAAWSSGFVDHTTALAWGDYDGDGDLDLAVGNYGQPDRLYENLGNRLATFPVWSSNDPNYAFGLSWGDYDNDGDLDLAAANVHGPLRIYRNNGTRLSLVSTWSSVGSEGSIDLAWGDYNGDGDLDLAAANTQGPIRLYKNHEGSLSATPVWYSIEAVRTFKIGWADYDGDGDVDLTASGGPPTRIYRNDHGNLTTQNAWFAAPSDYSQGLAWGDFDLDGDLDLAVGNGSSTRLYANTRDNWRSPGLPGNIGFPTVQVNRPSPPAAADRYSAPGVWPQMVGSVPISFTLKEVGSHPIGHIKAYYSPDGGGKWLPAVAASGTITTNLATSPTGITYTYNWNVFASGFFGKSDNVVFRIVAVPDLHPVQNSVPGPFLYGSNASSTFPFRVRGMQVRVMENGQPVKDTLVYRQPAGSSKTAQVITSLSGEPFKTDSQGYLQGRGTLSVGDRLFALAPISATAAYTLYHTNAVPTAIGLDGFTVTAPGVQTLVVSATHPLVLFNLDVSLEWDARNDTQFLSQLNYDLQRASEFLYDWSNGQAALGKLTVHHNRELWQDAHIRIYATNRLRPSAVQGGVVSEPYTETLSSKSIVYYPGQLYMGATWNRYGNAGSNLDEDWPRTLAHELGHYALYLQDNYLGRDAQGRIVPIDCCSGAMADPYRDDDLAGYGEFHPTADWLPACADTLSNRETGRSDWATITTFYPQLDGVTPNAGPSTLQLAVTDIRFVEPVTPTTTLQVPIFYLTQDGQRVQPGSTTRAFLYRGGWATDLGRATLDQLLARGAQPGDRVCLYELSAERLGCETVTLGDEQLALVRKPDWQPDIQVSPVTSRTLTLNVSAASSGLSLKARLYPLDTAAGDPISLVALSGVYSGTFNSVDPTFQGYVQVWVDEPEPRREAIIDVTLGGNPGHQRSGGGHQRSGGGHQRSGGAPVMSADGQVILFAPDFELEAEWFYTLQATSAAIHPPPWATLVGQAYRLSATADAPDLAGTSLSFSYLGAEVPPGEEDWLKLYFYDGTEWTQLATALDTYHNLASAPVQGPGIYALMSSFPITFQGPGWNLFGWIMPGTRPVVQTLQPISGAFTTVYGYEAEDRSDPYDPWKMYDPSVPAYANDLTDFKQAHGYWINISATAPITLWVKGGATAAATDLWTAPYPPSTYYGPVLPGPSFVPAPGMLVTARIGDKVCGQTRTLTWGGDIVYAINVFADAPGSTAGCGAAGRLVTFAVGSRQMATTAAWEIGRVWLRPLSVTAGQRLYLPLLVRSP